MFPTTKKKSIHKKRFSLYHSDVIKDFSAGKHRAQITSKFLAKFDEVTLGEMRQLKLSIHSVFRTVGKLGPFFLSEEC